MGAKLTVEEVCERLHISRQHFNQLVFRRQAPPRIVVSPRRFLIDEDDLEAWMNARRESGVAS